LRCGSKQEYDTRMKHVVLALLGIAIAFAVYALMHGTAGGI
jgi:hypothetical protein